MKKILAIALALVMVLAMVACGEKPAPTPDPDPTPDPTPAVITNADEIADEMTTEDGILTADCQFCGAHYEFDPATLGIEAAAADGDDPEGQDADRQGASGAGHGRG